MEDFESEEDDPGVLYYITMERVAHSATQLTATAPDFDINNIDIHSDHTDITNAALNLIQKLGYSFYYKKLSGQFLDKNGELSSTKYSAYFNRNVSVDFELNKLWLVSSITFTSPDPIAFNKLKKAFNLAGWTKEGSISEEVSYYSNKNVDCVINSNGRYIEFTINPPMSDIVTRVTLAPIPDLSGIWALRNFGSEAEVARNLSKKYLTKVKFDDAAKQYVYDASAYDLEFYFMSPAGILVNVYYKMVLTTDWSAPFIVYSNDKAYLQSLSAQFDSSDNFKNNYSKALKEGQFIIYDNKMEATRIANEAEQKRAETARVAATEERARQAELERQRVKAQKDAQFNENLRKATEIMQRMLKQ